MRGYIVEDSPLYAPGVVDAVSESPELFSVARVISIPVIHINVRYIPHNFEDSGVWMRKAPVLKYLAQENPNAETYDKAVPV